MMMMMQPILLLMVPLVHAQPPPIMQALMKKMERNRQRNCPVSSLWPSNGEVGNRKLLVGFLMHQISDSYEDLHSTVKKYGLTISGAFSWAVKTVNKGSILPDGYKMQFEVYDTHGKELIGTKYVTELICRNASAIFGPENTCQLEGAVAAANNRAMMSYACTNYVLKDKTKYSTFARINPSESTIVSATIELLKQNLWKKFSIIYAKHYTTIAEHLEAAAKTANMTINHKEIIEMWNCTTFFDDSKNSTRIYVYVGHPGTVNQILTCMAMSGLTSPTGKDTWTSKAYMLIYLHLTTFNPEEWMSLIWHGTSINLMVQQNKCLEYDLNHLYRGFMVVANPYPEKGLLEKIRKKVRKYNYKEPFCLGRQQGISRYVPMMPAASLYDSVILYAKAVREIWEEKMNMNHTEDVSVVDVASDGIAIVNRLKNRTYESILGYNMTLDHNAEGKGRYSVYLLDDCKMSNAFCSKCLVNIGNYEPQKEIILNLIINVSHIKDEPMCGYSYEKCPPNDRFEDIHMYGITVCLVVCIVTSIILYCKWMYKIRNEGLQRNIDARGLSYNSIELSESKVPS